MNEERVVMILEPDQFRRLWEVLELLETLLYEIRATNNEEEWLVDDLH